MERRILFCNIGWMTNYRGITPNDKIVGGGAYVHVEKRGHEVCNFLPAKHTVYGYVQPHGSQIRIERIGASADADEVNNVDVILTARRPGSGGTVIVGWYKDATVFRYPQEIKWASKTHENNAVDAFWMKAAAEHAVLLPIDQRNVVVPRGKGGMGQSNVWFADSPQISDWISGVDRIIRGEKQREQNGVARQHDPFKKAEVERAAIAAVTAHYENLGYVVGSVESENVGWDLEAKKDTLSLVIEVKGLSASPPIVELTPNEYTQMNGKRKSDYRLCIVVNALGNFKLRIFGFNHASGKWCDESGKELSFTEKVGAIASCI